MEAKHPQENALLTGVIWKQILLFFLPVALGTFFQQMYNTVDALVVGNFVGMNALGAVGGATASVINLILGFFVGVSSGATVVIADVDLTPQGWELALRLTLRWPDLALWPVSALEEYICQVRN